MKSEQLKVLSLNISEDNYDYRALFRLCTDTACMDVDLTDLSLNIKVEEIKAKFELDEQIEEIRDIITNKVITVSDVKSNVTEGENYSKHENKETAKQRAIDSLSMS
jgi:23S rRNA U2552 (ribose-2'-O)-methylase RlmE/FtsJ